MNDYAYIDFDGSPEDLEELFFAPIIAFDVESTGVNTGTSLPYGFSLSCIPNAAYYTTIEIDFFKESLWHTLHDL